MVGSYIEREQVDGKFLKALQSDKHIIVYGSSKQGKSALRRKHLSEEDEVLVQCGPKHDTTSIYSSILRQLGVQLEASTTKRESTNADVNGKFTWKAKIPFFGEAQTELGGKVGSGNEITTIYKSIEIDLSLAQDVGEVLTTAAFNKIIVLENFHYLDDVVQRQLAFDLRAFQEIGIRFLVLGIWRERNRLNQFNGDLVDRVLEVPVEPWDDSDFEKVITKGCVLLNLVFDEKIIKKILENSFGNIGIVQELCKELCLAADVQCSIVQRVAIRQEKFLDQAIEVKVQDYSSRHLRALESIADASRTWEKGLFLPYYIIKAIVGTDVSELRSGIRRSDLQMKIKEIHYRPDGVRPSDMTNLLHGLGNLQSRKSVIPPLFDYDRSNSRLRVIDSTLFFFLKFSDANTVLEEIPSPVDSE